MITALKYVPLLFSTTLLFGSMFFKLLFLEELEYIYIFKDLAVFFISYYVLKTLTGNIIKMFRNYWKIL